MYTFIYVCVCVFTLLLGWPFDQKLIREIERNLNINPIAEPAYLC